jgi:GMP synthase-like glutamine amidotransferase
VAKILILQHTEETPAGTTLDWCRERQLDPVIIKVWQTQRWPDPSDFLGVVLCGGGMDVDQEDRYPWLTTEKLFIKQLLTSKIKTLGLCLGAQLMAEVLGAKVYCHSSWEVGWHQVELSSSPLWNPESFPHLEVFQWHHYTFDIPPHCEKLGRSKSCPNQVFSYQSHGLAVQFHPEASMEWITDCANTKLETYTSGDFVQSRDQIIANAALQNLLQSWYWKVLDAFFISGRKGS